MAILNSYVKLPEGKAIKIAPSAPDLAAFT